MRVLRCCLTQGCFAMQATEIRAQTRGFGVFELDVRAAELRKRGVRIKLQEQPFQILCLLLDHSGQVVTREELRQKLWPAHTFVDFDRSLNKAMTKLRFALGDSAESPRYVETIPRHGYRFLAPVHDHHEGAEAATFSVSPSVVGRLNCIRKFGSVYVHKDSGFLRSRRVSKRQ